MMHKTQYSVWYENYFGKGTKEVTAYLDSLNRLFLTPTPIVELPKDHNCDAMGCGSVGPHIVAAYLPAERVDTLLAELAAAKQENEKLKKEISKAVTLLIPVQDGKWWHRIDKVRCSLAQALKAKRASLNKLNFILAMCRGIC